MEALWNNAPQSSTELTAHLTDKGWSEKTVRTFLNRLAKKNMVSFEKQGRRYLYFPLVERSTFLEQESKGFLTNIFKGDIRELLATFVNSKQLSEDEVAYLKRLLRAGKGDK